jgi:hypothetical protein
MLVKYALVILAVAPAALGATSTYSTAPSGLRGIVTRSPITPVCREGIPCSAPSKNTPLEFSRGEKSVTTQTDRVGHYRVALSPGWWSVRTATAPRIGSGIEPRTVRVFAARFRVVNFDIDTGIR